jgi:hypothetical protein
MANPQAEKAHATPNGTLAGQPPNPSAVVPERGRKALSPEQQLQAALLFQLLELAGTPDALPDALRLVADDHPDQKPALFATAKFLDLVAGRPLRKAATKRKGRKP